jgi:hypothetical protein
VNIGIIIPLLLNDLSPTTCAVFAFSQGKDIASQAASASWKKIAFDERCDSPEPGPRLPLHYYHPRQPNDNPEEQSDSEVPIHLSGIRLLSVTIAARTDAAAAYQPRCLFRGDVARGDSGSGLA